MGKGDKKTKRGKIIMGSYGVKRLRHKKTHTPVTEPKAVEKKKPVKKEVEPVAKEEKIAKTLANEEPKEKPAKKEVVAAVKEEKKVKATDKAEPDVKAVKKTTTAKPKKKEAPAEEKAPGTDEEKS